MYFIYKFVSIIITPLMPLVIKYRLSKQKEDPTRYVEKLGKYSKKKPNYSVVWIHCASLGEVMSTQKLLSFLLDKKLTILITTGTVSSANWVEKNLPKEIIHQFIPYDCPLYVNRFFKHWNPKLALWVESEIWPNIFFKIKKKEIPLLMINARISEKSYKNWLRVHFFSKSIFSSITACFSQSQQYEMKYKTLGASFSRELGNIKYSSDPLTYSKKELSELQKTWKNRFIILLSSSHDGEEKTIIEAYKNIKEKIPNILLIIVPRHSDRGTKIATLLKSNQITYAQRSLNQIKENIDIYLADTMGELGLFYRLSNLVIIGGSFISHGGQNPLQAAILKKPILFGPSRENFKEITENLIANKALIPIDNIQDLTKALYSLIQSKKDREKLSNNAFDYAQSQKTVLEKYITYIEPFLSTIKAEGK